MENSFIQLELPPLTGKEVKGLQTLRDFDYFIDRPLNKAQQSLIDRGYLRLVPVRSGPLGVKIEGEYAIKLTEAGLFAVQAWDFLTSQTGSPFSLAKEDTTHDES